MLIICVTVTLVFLWRRIRARGNGSVLSVKNLIDLVVLLQDLLSGNGSLDAAAPFYGNRFLFLRSCR